MIGAPSLATGMAAPPRAVRRQRLVPTRSRLALERLPLARQALAACVACLHRCGAPRLQGPAGRCHAGAEARFFSALLDVSDELELLPSFAVSLAGCNLRCDFCVTGESSWNARAGTPVDLRRLADQAAAAIATGARTIMILGGEPTLHLPALLELVAALPDSAPLVLKTNACFTEVAHPLLAGLFDVWLPDFKFGNARCAHRLAAIPLPPDLAGAVSPIATGRPPPSDYWTTVTGNLFWMAAQERSSDLIVRHLLMPGHGECCWKPIAEWLARHLPGTKVSLRSGYWPAWHAHRHAELRTPLPRSELARALDIAQACRLTLVP